MSPTAAVALNRRMRSKPPSFASSRRSNDLTVAAANGNGNGYGKFSPKPRCPSHAAGERTVKKLRLSKALTIPDGTTVSEACKMMAVRRVDAVLLTDANDLLSGILTDKDIATRVIAEGLRVEQTLVSKIMTRNPVYVTSDTLAIEALQKMVQGKFRHLPVVENGEVIAMLNIAKCLYDAISRLERAAEQGNNALAAAVEGVERQLGGNVSSSQNIIETLREQMYKLSLSTIITENTKVATASPSDPVYVATQKMRDLRVNSVVVTAGNSLLGIFTSKDVLMRVVAQNLSPELTLVEKVMTAHPDCATLDMTILDALHIMHDGKFLHIPVLDGDGRVVACLDVLQLTHAAISMFEGGPGTANDVANTMMQKFWNSALALEPPDEDFDSHSELSLVTPSEAGDGRSSMYPPAVGNSFVFKLRDQNGRMHRFTCGYESLDELISSVMQRLGIGGEKSTVQLLTLKLHIDDSDSKNKVAAQQLSELEPSHGIELMDVHYGLMACGIALTGVAMMVFLRHSTV
ncbi:CBS domain-containing protein CBSCBSPB3-like isoform X2 [Panicum virgatum]|uniref:CBS domain-containing protein CBSCBSPB3-like isoform X2 n=1 Tax=Panicum virgatum TaxID=38727 RepID=UPI0019D5B05C|nr:CBS domain-containing protein CBSCBSPB3-like isoform X2 [Panicum virgatum]